MIASTVETMKKIFIIFILVSLFSCRSNKKTLDLLNSTDKEDKIRGAYRAGKSPQFVFVPLLLKDAYDPHVSTNIRFKGLSVYKAKMMALSEIFKQDPPVEITKNPDSVVIKFFIELAKKEYKLG